MSEIRIDHLRAMRERWKRDLARLETAYPVTNWEASEPSLEVIRNLATAIAEIDPVIARQTCAALAPAADEGAR